LAKVGRYLFMVEHEVPKQEKIFKARKNCI